MSQPEQVAQEQPLSAKEVLGHAVDAAYLAEGYINTDGEKDRAAVGNALYPLIARARVESLGERATKAVTRGELVDAAFPSLPKREDWSSQPDPQLAEDVYRDIWTKVWDLAKPDGPAFCSSSSVSARRG